MPRVARVVVPGCPHHITNRGNNRETIFCEDSDRLQYLRLLRHYCRRFRVAVFGFCLMSNHIHLILRPEQGDGLAQVLRHTHAEYAQPFNRRNGRCGHLWQNRFYSCPLDRSHTWSACRYVDLNPVRAHMVHAAGQWRWSSTRAHLSLEPDEFGLLAMDEWCHWRDRPDWEEWLGTAAPDADRLLRNHTRQSRPLGSESFVNELESVFGRRLRVRANGRPRKNELTAAAAG